ncbi:hypothetical protein ACFLR8_03955, partial [Bacteroidota bacterium]
MIHKKLFVIFVLLMGYISAFSAPSLIAEDAGNNIYPITFTDEDQLILDIHFDEDIINLGNTSGWTILIAGSSVAFFGPIFDPIDHSIIKFQLASSITYPNKDSVTVSYDKDLSTASPKLGGASGEVELFGPVTAVNNLLMTCDAFDLNKFDFSLLEVGKCAPITVRFTVAYYINSHYLNSINYNKNRVILASIWGDGLPASTISGAEVSLGKFEHTFEHPYPDDPTVCYWNNLIYPGITGEGYCLGGGLRKLFTYENHSTDDEGDGVLNMHIDTIQVCLGQDFTEIFTDATYFNCNPQTEPDFPNDGPRNIRFTYGTLSASGPRIKDILVDGNPLVGPLQSAVIPYDSIRNNGSPAPTGWASSLPISHVANLSTDSIGQIFEITLENWGPCNPYNIFETNAPIITRSYIKIVDGPIAEAGADFAICEGTSATLNGQILQAATDGLWNTNSGDGSFSNPDQPSGAEYTPGTNDISNGGVWLVLTASNSSSSCPDHLDSIYLTIDPLPAQSTINYGFPTSFCYDFGITYSNISSTLLSPSNVYQWYKDVAPTGITTRNVVIDTPAESGSWQVRLIGNTALNCPGPFSDPLVVTVYDLATTTHPANETICENTNTSFTVTPGGAVSDLIWQVSNNGGIDWSDLSDDAIYSGTTTNTLSITNAPFAINNNQYRIKLTTTAGSCEAYSNAAILTLTPAPTAYAGADAAICEDETYHIADASASNYDHVEWSVVSGNGNVSNTGIENPVYNPNALDAATTVILELTSYGNGSCANVTDQINIFVDAIPTASATATQEICGDVNAFATLDGNTGGNDLNDGATGLWTFPSIWREDFNDLADGTEEDLGATAWSRLITNTGGGWYSRVISERYQLASNRTVWTSEQLDISGFTDVGISIDLSSSTSGGDNFDIPNDYIRVSYIINGTPTEFFSCLGSVVNNTDGTFTTVQAIASGINGPNLTIQIEARNSTTTEQYYFDNITITEGNSPIISDPTDPKSTVTNLPSGATTFTWTVSSANGGCTPTSATHEVTRWDPPSAADAGSDDSVCEDDDTHTLVGNVPVYGSGVWSTTGGANITSVGSATTGVTDLDPDNNEFTWTISNGTCPDETAVVNIFRDSPVVPGNLSTNQQLCQGETPAPLTGTPATGGDGSNYTYEWQFYEVSTGLPWIPIGSSNNAGYSPGPLSTTTRYRRLVSSGNASCLTQQDVPSTNIIEITVELTLFAGAISGDQSICFSDNPAAFNSDAAASGGNPPYTYEWYKQLEPGGFVALGINNAVYDESDTLVQGTHNYYREVSSSTGYCAPVQTGQVTIIVNPGPTTLPATVVSGDAIKCEDETITLTCTPVPFATNYVWDFSWEAGQVNATTTLPTIDIDLSSYSFTSPSEAVQVFAAGINGCNVLGVDYFWSAAHDLTIYTNPVANAGTNDTVCGFSFITLNATASVGSRLWTDLGTGPGSVGFDNASSPAALATASRYGTYTLQWQEDNGGCIDNDNVSVTFWEQPTATVPPADQDLCGTLNAPLVAIGHSYQALSTPDPEFLWEWVSGPDNDPQFGDSSLVSTSVTVDYYGTYQFRLTETNGTCTNNVLANVTFSENPTLASAGTDIDALCDANSTPLNGTAHSYLGAPNINTSSRTWEYVSGLDNSPSYGLVTDPTTSVTVGINQLGNYEFKWEETNGACIVRDTVIVKFFEDPNGIVSSGPFEAACGDLDINISVTAHGYTRGDHPESTRGWSRISGPDLTPTFTPVDNPATNVAVTNYGTYVFRWTENNGPCTQFTDVTVTYYEEPTGASAGSDLTSTCNFKSVNLTGTAHTYVDTPDPGSSRGWSWKSGPDNSPTFTPVTSNTAEAAVDFYGTYEFYWTETNGNCTVKDSAIIKYYQDPVNANAGTNFNAACGLQFATLDGTAHIYDADPNDSSESTQLWTVFSSPGGSNPNFNDDTDPKTTVTVDVYGTYIFVWTETNGNCTRSSQVTVNFFENPVNASAGADQAGACGDRFLTLAGTAHGYLDTPDPGSSQAWSYFSGPDNTPDFVAIDQPNATVTVDDYGIYEFIWTEINGNCIVRDTMIATFYEAGIVIVNPVADVCRDSSLAVIPISGTYGGGAIDATWSIEDGGGSLQNIVVGAGTATAEYVPIYADLINGSFTVRLTTNDPSGPCTSIFNEQTINIDESVYVIIDQAPAMSIAEGDVAVLTASITGATNGIADIDQWTVQGPSLGGIFNPDEFTINVTFDPTLAQETDGGVTLRLSSDPPSTSCPVDFDEVFIAIGANPVADAGDDKEDCEPADSLIYVTGWAKKAANDADWTSSGAGTIINQTKTWSIPQSVPDPDENDSLFVEATYKLDPADYGTPSGFSTFIFTLTTNDPDFGGPVLPDTDEMDYVVNWGPNTPAIGGGGKGTMCVNSLGNLYSVPLRPGNTYLWEIEVLSGAGVPGVDYIVQAGGTGNNFIAIHWINVGTYNLKVTETTYQTDAVTPCVGETVSKSIAVYNPPVATAEPDTTICQNDVISLRSNVTDGSGDYSYEWAPAVGLSDALIAEPDVTGLFVGAIGYNLKVTDNVSGCESGLANITIVVDPLPAIYTLSGPSYYCDGAVTGVTLILSDSEVDVDYTLYNGAIPVSTRTGDGDTLGWTNNFIGSYYVKGVRNLGPACERDMAGIINITPNPPITVAENSIVEPLCNGGSTGSISITPGGGTSPYTFDWAGPGAFGSTNEDITGLAAGDYTVEVTDSRNCTYTHTPITVGEPDALNIISLTETNPISCYGGNEGELTVVIDPLTGTAPFSYQWYYDASFSNPVAGAISNILSGMTAATYYVIVTDVNGCTAQSNGTLTNPSDLTLTPTSDVALSCFNDNTATGTFTVAGGTPGGGGAYTFVVTSNTAGATMGVATNTTIDFTGGSVGEVSVEVTDFNGCTETATITITEPPELVVSYVKSLSPEGSHNISCFNGNDGGVTVTVNGGVAPYTYAWSTADGGGIIAGAQNQSTLLDGTYTLTVTDANSCTWTDNAIDLTEPTQLTVGVVTDDAIISTCPTSVANLTATAVGGVNNGPGYSYGWTPTTGLTPISGATPVAKPPITTPYIVTATDDNGCTANNNITITVATTLSAFASVDDNIIGTCPSSVATVSLTVNGGEAGYTYSWVNTTTGLTDDILDVLGGVAGSGAALQNPVLKPTNSGLNTYEVSITDVNGCTTTTTVNVTLQPDVTAVASASDLIIGTCSSSTLSVVGGGGEEILGGGYTYAWLPAGELSNASAQSPVFTPATPNYTENFTVTITDRNGCTAVDVVSIDVTEDLTITSVTADDTIIGTCKPAQITSVITGGEEIGGGGYYYSWSPGTGLSNATIPNPVASPVNTTTYTLTVTDENGCTDQETITITVMPLLTVTSTPSDYSIGECNSANITTVVTGGEQDYLGEYQYSWTPSAGLSFDDIAEPVANPLVTTMYTLTVTDTNNCTAQSSFTITVVANLAATISASDLIIGDCNNSSLDVTVTGGEPSGGLYTYLWAPNDGTLTDINIKNPIATPTVLGDNVYTVTITDNNGCSINENVTINLRDVITAAATTSDDQIGTCAGSLATLDVNVTSGGEEVGGGGFYYSWDPTTGLNNASLKSPTAKPAANVTYTVTITDANGCLGTANVDVNVASPLTVSASAVDAIIGTCPGQSTVINTTVIGGEELVPATGYSYSWNPSASLDLTDPANPVASPATTTTYTVTVTDNNGCQASTNITVTVVTDLALSITADDVLIGTCVTSTSQITAIASGGEMPLGDYIYSWSPVAGLSNDLISNPVADLTVTGSYLYTLTVTDDNG